ncbi:AAA-28 domain-containing protein [Aphelenchoides fujianensis]|nr:AAA-28 domain-containing protein [Aphelenchoides fujianensis]
MGEQEVKLRRNKHNKRICKIVLTGGPCAGKTTAMHEIANRIKADFSDRWQVFVVTEASSLLYTGRVQRSAMNEEQVKQWQMDVLSTILQLESVYDNIAMQEWMQKAYTADESTWKTILEKINLSEDLLFARYDAYAGLWSTHPGYFVVDNFNAHNENDGRRKKVFEIFRRFLLSTDYEKNELTK